MSKLVFTLAGHIVLALLMMAWWAQAQAADPVLPDLKPPADPQPLEPAVTPRPARESLSAHIPRSPLPGRRSTAGPA